jgi:hypothetical protein
MDLRDQLVMQVKLDRRTNRQLLLQLLPQILQKNRRINWMSSNKDKKDPEHVQGSTDKPSLIIKPESGHDSKKQ